MNKKFLIPIVALVLVSCAKNETLRPADSHLSEITFNVAPKTKADDAHGHKSFDSKNMFVSWAYYLAPGKTWPTDVASAELYINGAKIKNTNPTGTDGWKPGKKYTVDLTFSLDEITWDPAVQDWENVTAADITIK